MSRPTPRGESAVAPPRAAAPPRQRHLSYAASDWNAYTITNLYDHKNRRIFKSFLDTDLSKEAQWYFTYDQLDRLVEVKHIPDIATTTTYSIYDFYWIEDRPVAYYQLDFASGSGTVTTRRFLHADEINRPLEAWSWPTSGDATRVWAINPSSDQAVVGRVEGEIGDSVDGPDLVDSPGAPGSDDKGPGTCLANPERCGGGPKPDPNKAIWSGN